MRGALNRVRRTADIYPCSASHTHMGEPDREQLKASLEELVERKDELQAGDETLQHLFFEARSLASELGYTKVENQIRNREFEHALALLTDNEVVA